MEIQGHLQLSIRFEASLDGAKYRDRERHTGRGRQRDLIKEAKETGQSNVEVRQTGSLEWEVKVRFYCK